MSFFFPTISEGKSGKREVAIALLMLWGFITVRHFMWVDLATHAAQKTSWDTLTMAVIPFAAAAFGFDAYLKNKPVAPPARQPQSHDRRPPGQRGDDPD